MEHNKQLHLESENVIFIHLKTYVESLPCAQNILSLLFEEDVKLVAPSNDWKLL